MVFLFKAKNDMRKLYYIALVAIILAIGGIYALDAQNNTQIASADITLKKISKVTVGNHVFHAERAETPQELAHGLKSHTTLSDSQGMLFIFKEPHQRTFWMRDMHIPIDLLWIKNNKIIGFEQHMQPEREAPFTLYQAPDRVDHVLEIQAGAIAKKGISIGDAVLINER